MSSSYWFPVFGGDAGKVLIQEVFDSDEAQTEIGKKGQRRPFKVIFPHLLDSDFCFDLYYFPALKLQTPTAVFPLPKC